MTFNSAAWAIDGALVPSALARRSTYASTGGNAGIVNKDDLKVLPLAVPGVGVRISAGVGLVVNDYQTTPNETYVVSNPAEHTISSGEMPPSDPAAKSYIVAVTVGDPEFSQVGHPWMTSDDPAPGEESTFQYVRPVLVAVANSSVTELDVDYPALPLARIDVPANTTTITAEMITDLRSLAQPRVQEAINHASFGGTNALNGAGGTPGEWERWPNMSVITVKVPEWATVAKVLGFVEGAILTKATLAKLRIYVEESGKSSAVTNIDDTTGTNVRRTFNVGGTIDVSDVAGQTIHISMQGTPNNTASKGGLTTNTSTSVLIRALFEEVPS